MNRYLIIIAVVFGTFAAALAVVFSFMTVEVPQAYDDGITLPSGRIVTFHEVIHSAPGTSGQAMRFRFVETDLAEVAANTDYADLEADMAWLCKSYALERIANTGPQPAQVIISIADKPVAFGEPDPGVTQIFEAYRPEDGACIWEGL